MFVQRALVSEIKYYRSRKDEVEVEDLLCAISGFRRRHTKEIKELRDRIEKLCACLRDSL